MEVALVQKPQQVFKKAKGVFLSNAFSIPLLILSKMCISLIKFSVLTRDSEKKNFAHQQGVFRT